LFCFCRPRTLVIWCGGLLVGYWAMMSWVPVPGGEAGNLAEGANLANWVDSQFLPFRKWDGNHDPEGLLSTIPAISSCLLGVFAGLLMKDAGTKPLKKVGLLLGSGLGAILVGWLWSLHFPVIKKLWTSSYVLVAAGWSAIFLAVFYYVIDVLNWKRWAAPFVWIGMNPIAIYMIGNLVAFDDVAARFVGGPVKSFIDVSLSAGMGDVVISIVGMVMTVGICWFLHRRNVFIRL
jgi:predicted acyltransferase